MKKYLLLSLAFITSCGGGDKESFIKELEQKNNISYTKVENFGAYIPPQCYTKTLDSDGTVHNPCYTCHTQGTPPNFWNDTDLQESYNF
ncbi:hypothetical protein [Hydrogenobacter thermophilus]|uniref:Lipoprotein n=1 Tax=Hydrogenobacter thermophilus (strain DSM 6534 / IAM 12695 / TK-6) TaxID=608538 RepID=D3DFR0_HYDTT|nr:hypothetical protein [Hydrogenobacter thermophilus]BAI68662.1 hypothetical protein HTH_0195 [Hydrogenobacter thermophilus TK-6]